MDLQTGQASRQDLAYIQTQMKNVYATQAEHADRIMRLEQRQDGDSRLKSVWGNQSPYNGMLNGNPQQGMEMICSYPAVILINISRSELQSRSRSLQKLRSDK